jgi:predicted nucleic acid-binding Zn ribbon protein
VGIEETHRQDVSAIRGHDRSTIMKEYQFVCSTCTQEIAVNEEMRDAILANGCPVCAAAVTTEDFS